MQLHCYKTLWGFNGAPAQAVAEARAQGYNGIEGPIPVELKQRHAFADALTATGMSYIAEVATGGNYVPDRRWTLQQHLDDVRQQLDRLSPLQPSFITCLGACDAWPLTQALEFFQAASGIAKEYGLTISFETHRGRSLFTPWAAAAVVKALPEIKLTLDVSHWWVVCEGLQETDLTLITQLLDNVHHVHGRVGYDQGPQVPSPFHGVYRQQLQNHLALWKNIWLGQQARGVDISTVTPEFGPDGYDYRDLDGGQTLVDIADINLVMAATLRESFAQTVELK